MDIEPLKKQLTELGASKTVIGCVIIAGSIVARVHDIVPQNEFEIALGIGVGLAGFGVRDALRKMLGPLSQIASTMPKVVKAIGAASEETAPPGENKISKTAVINALLGLSGIIGTIGADMAGSMDEKTFATSMAVSSGLLGIGGRAAIGSLMKAISQLAQFIPIIEAALQGLKDVDAAQAEKEKQQQTEKLTGQAEAAAKEERDKNIST